MTVDLDLLADYVEGVLEPDDQARVESLVQHDREWASAHDALLAALPSVAADLASVTFEPMPASVLAATLQSFAAERAATAADRTDDGAHKRDVTRPGAGRPPTSGTKKARRRELRAAAFGAFVLVLVVAIGLGLVNRNNVQSVKGSDTANGNVAAPQAAGGSHDLAGQEPVIIASGTDYTQLTLPNAYGVMTAPPLKSPARTPNSIVPAPELTSAGLERLGAPGALAACLSEVAAAVGGTPIVVDYARFQGTPALIVSLISPKSVIAVGADCGLPGRGIDELARS